MALFYRRLFTLPFALILLCVASLCCIATVVRSQGYDLDNFDIFEWTFAPVILAVVHWGLSLWSIWKLSSPTLPYMKGSQSLCRIARTSVVVTGTLPVIVLLGQHIRFSFEVGWMLYFAVGLALVVASFSYCRITSKLARQLGANRTAAVCAILATLMPTVLLVIVIQVHSLTNHDIAILPSPMAATNWLTKIGRFIRHVESYPVQLIGCLASIASLWIPWALCIALRRSGKRR